MNTEMINGTYSHRGSQMGRLNNSINFSDVNSENDDAYILINNMSVLKEHAGEC